MRQGAAFWFVLIIALAMAVVVVGGGWWLANQMGVVDLRGDPDMEVTMSASSATVAAGGSVTYTVNYSNTGESPAGSVTLTVTLPQGATVGEVVPGAACSTSESTVACRLGTQNAGRNGTVTVAATVPSTASAGATLEARAEIKSSTTRDVKSTESVTDNNSASATVTVQ